MGGLSISNGLSKGGGLSLGQGLSRGSGLSPELGYDPSAGAWFAAMPTQPTAQVKTILNTFIVGLKAANLWSVMDGGNFFCLETLAQGLVDFKNPARVATLAPGFTSTFLTYRGVTGSGSLAGTENAYIDTGFNPATAGGNWTLNSAHTSIYCATNVAEGVTDFGANTAGSDYYHVLRNATSVTQIRSNSSTTTGIVTSVTTSVGFSTISRTGASALAAYKDGTLAGSSAAQASVSLPNGTLRAFQIQTTAANTKQLSYIDYGAGFDATQAANLNSIVTAAVTALRAL